MSRNPETPAPSYRSPKLFLLLFRLELLMIVACISAGGLAAAGVLNNMVSPWLFTAAAATGEGLLMGMLGRAFFRSFSRLLQWAAGLAGTAAGLIVLGWLTRGLTGVDLNGRMQFGPDWMALVQLLIGAVASTLVYAAGRIRYPERKPEPAGAAESAGNSAAPSSKIIKTDTPEKEIRPVRERIRSALKFFRKSNHDAEIRLVGSEEHKCPYCLQPIAPRDPRGVVTCPICHARHHKDCWDITGMCQVPHYHT
jgi:ribosomal protein L37AE/L43A